MRAPSRRVILIAVNGALLAGVGVFALSSAAVARQSTARVRGNYAMVAGKMAGASTSPVYVVDSVNQELIALTWNRNAGGGAGSFEVFGWRSLSGDSGSAQRNR